MSDEIKEILDYLNKSTNSKDFVGMMIRKDHLDKLLNYITNLQEENERLTRFKYNIPNDKTTSVPTITKSYKKEYENYKSRCEKAIPMLKELNIKLKDILKIGIDIKEISDIENILNGGDEE